LINKTFFYYYFQGAGNIPNFCDVGLKISGLLPISAPAGLVFPETQLTSVTLATTEQHTVAFVGTNQGLIKKVSTRRNVQATDEQESTHTHTLPFPPLPSLNGHFNCS